MTNSSSFSVQDIDGCVALFMNDVTPGRETEYIEKVEEHVLPLYRKHGVDLVGCFRVGIGARSNTMVFLINYHSFEQYNALYSDPEYVKMDKEMGFQEMRSLQSWLLDPVSFSAIK